jgi:hypothetical protein
MSYMSAARDAERAKEHASSAAANAEDPAVADLARAVEYLSEAVAALAKTHHRES